MHGERTNAARTSKRGFTLIELMVVIVILGALVALVGPSVWNALVGSTRDTVRMQIRNFEGAIQQYYLDTRSLPQSLQDLVQESKKTGERYLSDPKVPQDPWGQEYQYQIMNASKREYMISSSGDDKIAGTADDIVWTSAEGFK